MFPSKHQFYYINGSRDKFIKINNLLATIEKENDSDEKKALEKIILIKVPTETYPTLYETFVYLFAQAGIKNISIEKEVNFEKMYNEKNKS